MPQLKGATIVFDLDGTLVDTAPDLYRALAATLALDGLPPPPASAVRDFVGHGARAMIQRGIAHNGAPSKTAEELAALLERFLAFYSADIARESRPFPGAIEALDALAADGARLAVCTNKRQALSEQLLDALGLSARFAAIVGADSVPARKPDPGHYRAAVAAAGGAVGRSLMIGDSHPDLAAAHAAGAPCVLVRFGYSPEPVERLGADALIDAYAELPRVAHALLKAEG